MAKRALLPKPFFMLKSVASDFHRSKNAATKVFLSLLMLLATQIAFSQTTLISPTVNNGGFESGTSPWVIDNGSEVNYWVISNGATSGFSGANCAYVTNSSSSPYSHDYDNVTSATVHLYQDVTFPAGETYVSLSFDWVEWGESDWDRLLVYMSDATPSGAMTPGDPSSNSTFLNGYTLLATIDQSNSWTSQTMTIPAAQVGNATAASTRRLLFVWQNDGSGGSNPPIAIDNVTLTSACPGVNVTGATAVTGTTATLNWDPYTGATGYLVRYKKTSDPATVATWATPTSVSGGSTTSLAVSGLSPNQTVYEYQVSAVGGGCGTWMPSAYFSTACGTFPLPYYESFEGIPADDVLPQCMDATNLGWLTRTYTSATGFNNQYARTGDKFGSFRWNCNDWFFTPAITLTAGQSYRFRFYYITDGYSGWTELSAAYGTSASGSSMTNVVGTPVAGAMNTSYMKYEGVISPSTTGDYYFGINCLSNFNPAYLSIDDISVDSLPQCTGTPVAGVIDPAGPIDVCTGSSVNLTATGTSVAASLTYLWIQSTDNGTTWQPATGTGGATDNFTSSSLIDTTIYKLVVACTNTGLTDTTDPVTVNVEEPVYASLPFTESFENWSTRCDNSDIPSTSWSNAPSTGDNSWRRDDEGAAGNWTYETDGMYNPAYVDGSHSARYHAVYAPQNSQGTLDLYINCSTAPGDKELQFYMITDPTQWGGDSVKVYYSDNGGQSFNYLQGFDYTSGLWVQKILSVPSNAANTIIRFVAKADYQYYNDIGIDYVRVLPACTGTPVAGTVNDASPCANTNFDLTLSGSSASGNLSYQWQDSTAASPAWSNVSPGGTTAIGTGNINGPTWFRCIVTCNNSGLSDTTAPKLIELAAFYYCYCNSSAQYNWDDDIGNVTVTTEPGATVLLNNGVASPLTYNSAANNMYTDFRYTVPPMVMYWDSLYRLSVTQINQYSFYNCTMGAYIDYDRNGQFDPGELLMIKTTSDLSTPPQEVNDTFRVPPVTGIGLTGMRVILEDGTGITINPCGTFYAGETEDYLVELRYPPCDGPTNAGTAEVSDTVICPGYTVFLTDTTHEYHRTGITWAWQYSPDNATWFDIPNTTDQDTLTQLVTGVTYYRLKMICLNTNDTSYSVPAKVNLNAGYKCYCYSEAVGGKQDSTDIGSFTVGNFVMTTGGPHLLNPQAIRRRTDYTGITGIELYADSTYALGAFQTLRGHQHRDAKITMFMDFNNNLVYDVPQERVWTALTSAADFYLTGSVTIPNTVITDVPTGMRIIINEDINPNVPSDEACGPYQSGETEDYIVTFRRAFKAGVETPDNLEVFSLYPNPTDGKVTISFISRMNMDDVVLTVTDITGRQLSKQTYKPQGRTFKQDLDLGKEARGVYFVQLEVNGDKIVRKVVLQ